MPKKSARPAAKKRKATLILAMKNGRVMPVPKEVWDAMDAMPEPEQIEAIRAQMPVDGVKFR